MKHHRLFTLLLAVVACSDESIPTAAKRLSFDRSDPRYQLAAAANGRIERGSEDDILRLENFVPGLGGVYQDGENIVVYAPPGLSRGEVLAKIALGVTSLNLDPVTYQKMLRGEKIVLRPARYSFSQLVSWVEGGAGGVMRTPGVRGIDANEVTNRVTILLSDSTIIPSVLRVTRTAGLPNEAVDFLVVNPSTLSGLKGTWSTTMGGIQIQNDSSINCSLGYNDQYNDIKGFWTAGHCSRNRFENGALYEPIYQPIWSGGVLGNVIMRADFSISNINCAGVYCNYVDAMYVEYANVSRWASRVAQLEGLTTVAPDSTPVVGDVDDWWTNVNLGTTPSSWWVGIPLDKVGRTTGWSRGKLGYTCQTVTFNIPNSSLTQTVLCNDVIVPDTLGGGTVNVPYSGGGDSGGPVFISNNNTSTELKALGIVIGGTNRYVALEGNHACTSNDCWVYYNRLSRIKMYVHAPF